MTSHTVDKDALAELIAWLRKRGEPDSGIRYEAGSHSNTRGIRHSLARVELHGSDADFIANNFHGKGARDLADALSALPAVSREPVAWQLAKPLEWAKRSEFDNTEYAETPLGNASVWEINGYAYYCLAGMNGGKPSGSTVAQAKAGLEQHIINYAASMIAPLPSDREAREVSALAPPLSEEWKPASVRVKALEEARRALLLWVDAASGLADQPGMEAHFHDVADRTLDTIEAAREALKTPE